MSLWLGRPKYSRPGFSLWGIGLLNHNPEVSKDEPNPDTLVEWLLSCTDVKTLLGAAAAHIKAVSGDSGNKADATSETATLKRTYTKTKAALSKAAKEDSSGQAEVEWLFSRTEVRLLLVAVAAQIKASLPPKPSPQRIAVQMPVKDEIILCCDEDDDETMSARAVEPPEDSLQDFVKSETMEKFQVSQTEAPAEDERCNGQAEVQRGSEELATAHTAISELQAELEKLRAAGETASVIEKARADELEQRCAAQAAAAAAAAATARDTVSQLQAELEALRSTKKLEGDKLAKAQGDELAKLRTAHTEETQTLTAEAAKNLDRIAALKTRGDDFEKLHIAQVEEAKRWEAQATDGRKIISQLKIELEAVSAVADGATVAAKARSDEFEKLHAAHADEAKRLKAEAAEAQDANSLLQAELKRQVATAESEVTKERARCDDLEKLHAAHEERAQGLEAEVAQTRGALSELQAELETLRAAAESHRASAQASGDEIEKLRDAQLREKQRLDVEAAKSEDTIAQLRTELETLRAAAEDKAAAGKARYNELEKLHAASVDEVHKLETEARKAIDTTSRLHVEIETLRSVASDREASAEKAQHARVDEAQKLQAETTKAHDAVSHLQTELETLQEKAVEDKTRFEEVEQRSSAQSDKIQKLEGEVSESHDKISQLSAELQTLRASAADREIGFEKDRHNELEKLRDAHRDEVDRLQSEVVVLHDAVAAERSKGDALEKRCTAQAADAQALEAEMAKTRSILSELQAELQTSHAAAQREIAAAKGSCDELEKLRSTQLEDRQMSKVEITKLQDTMDQLQAELDTVRMAADKEAAAAKARDNEAEKLHAASVDEVQRLEIEASKAHDTLSQLHAELAALRSGASEHEASVQQAHLEELERIRAAQIADSQQAEAEMSKARRTTSLLQAELEKLQVTAAADKARTGELAKLYAAQTDKTQKLESETKAKHDELEKLCAEHREEVRKLQSEVATTDEAIAAAKAKCDEIEKRCATQMSETQKWEAEVAKTHSVNSDLQAELETCRAAAEAQTAAAKTSRNELEKLRAAKAEEFEEFSIARADDVRKLETQIEEGHERNSQLQAKLGSLQKAAAEDKSRVEELEKMYAAQADKTQQLEGDAVEIRNKNTQLDAELESLRSAAAEQEIVEKGKHDELAKLRAVHRDEVQRLESEVATNNEAVIKAEAKGAELEKRCATQMVEASKLEARIDEFERMAEIRGDELERLRGEQTEERQSLEAEKVRRDELEKLNAMQAEEAKKWEAEAMKARASVLQLQRDLETSQAAAQGETAMALQRLEAEVATAREETVAAKIKCNNIENICATQEKDVHTLQADITMVREALIAQKAKGDESEKLRASQTDDMQKLEAELTTAREAVSMQKARGDEVEKLHAAQEDDVQRLAAEAADAHDTVSQLQAEMDTVRAAIHSETVAAKAKVARLVVSKVLITHSH